MRIAYLILAHNTPNHMQRLLSALRYGQDDFYIHIDRKSACNFENSRGERIFFTRERIPVYWGEFSQVEAILKLIGQALESSNRYDYFILLSGSDYPICSPAYIHNYLHDNYGKEFINITEMPNNALGKPLTRIAEYRVGSDRPSTKYIYEMMVEYYRKLGGGYFKRNFRKIFGDLVPYGGSEWWALTSDACRYVIDFINTNCSIYNFFKNTHCPDEMFFQTILGNSRFKDNIRRNLTYTDWEKFGPPFPATINQWHIDFIKSDINFCISDGYGTGRILFARKFPDESEMLIRILDGASP